MNKGGKKQFPGFGAAVFILSIFLLVSSPCLAQQKGAQPRPYKVVVKGKIVKGEMIESAPGAWLSAATFSSVMSAMGARSSFDQPSRLMVIEAPGSVGKVEGLPFQEKNPMLIVLNSGIYKVPCLEEAGSLFLPFSVAQKIFAAMGYEAKEDKTEALLVLSGSGIQDKPAQDAAAEKTNATKPETVASTSATEGDTPSQLTPEELEQRGQVREYMDHLKGIFDKYKPSGDDFKKLQNVAQEALGKLGNVDINMNDLADVVEKYTRATDEIKTLKPPNLETSEIQDLAISVFGKMGRLMQLAIQILTMEKGYDNPQALEKFQVLRQEINSQTTLFDQKVRAVRKKYDLGNP